MKIIHISNFGRRAKGAFQHGVGPKISNGLTRNGHWVANFSDRDVARAGSLLGHRKFGIGAANRELVEFCRNTEPDLLLFGHADVIRPETIAVIREERPALRVLQWNVDPLFEPDNIRRLRTKLDVVDATLVSTAGQALRVLERPGMRLGFLPNPVDYSIESGRNHERDDLPYDLFYACGNPEASRYTCGADWLPPALMQAVKKAAPNIRALTPGLDGEPHVAGARYQKALESAGTGLNLSRRNDNFLYSSDRVAQMAGNGMAILMDRATGYDTLFGEDQFAFFSTVDELGERVARLARDRPYRQALASAGRARYHALFNEQIVARYIVDVAFGTLKEGDYPWPTLV